MLIFEDIECHGGLPGLTQQSEKDDCAPMMHTDLGHRTEGTFCPLPLIDQVDSRDGSLAEPALYRFVAKTERVVVKS